MTSLKVAFPFSVVIPAYNAATTLPALLRDLLEVIETIQPPEVEIVVVDDGSRDATVEAVQPFLPRVVRLVRHRRNRGYGAALKTGIRHAQYDVIVTMDSDGQHLPQDLPALLQALKEGVDMVSGLRRGVFHTPLWRQPGKAFIRHLAQFLVAQAIPDINCGYRVFRKKVALKYLHLCPEGFSFSTTLLLSFLSRSYEVVFVPIQARLRKGGRSRVSVWTGFETILLVLRLMTLFSPLRVFIPVSIGCVAVGVLWGIPYYLAGHGLSTGALLFLLTGILVFLVGLLADQIAALRKERLE